MELSPQEKAKRRYAGIGNYRLVRYADDFIVLSNDGIAGVQQAKQEIRDFLKTQLHLELSEEKTLLTHVNDGFDFLGFHIQDANPKDAGWCIFDRQKRAKSESRRNSKT